MRDLERITSEIAAQVSARAGEVLHRLSPEGRAMRERQRARRRAAVLRGFQRLLIAWFAIVVGAIAFGLIVAPLGVNGVMAVIALLFLALAAIVAFSMPERASRETLPATDLPRLPQRTEAWLADQRALLPAPAARLTDGIGLRLEALAPQLQTLDPQAPAAAEVRKLIADDLPELIESYKRVPEPLRRQARDGRPSPDAQLAEGLRLVDDELKQMCEQLASGELTRLATQGRYMELKYRGDEELR